MTLTLMMSPVLMSLWIMGGRLALQQLLQSMLQLLHLLQRLLRLLLVPHHLLNLLDRPLLLELVLDYLDALGRSLESGGSYLMHSWMTK